MWELDYKESWVLKNWLFWTVVLEKTLESPLEYKQIHPVHPKGNQSWIFIGRTDAEAETPILWPPDAKNWLIWKDPDAGKDWRREEKGTTEDETVGWHLGSISTNKASGGDRIPAELFQILKDDAVKVHIPAKLENSSVATGLEKVSFHFSPKERQCQNMFKLPHNCTISHARKIMLKILQARLQQYVNWELSDVQAGFRKGRGTRDQIANICWVTEKARKFQKKHLLLLHWLH